MEYGWRVRVSGNALIENYPKGFYVCHMPGSPKASGQFFVSHGNKEKARKTTWERKHTKIEI